jgi:hypothetical protein
VTRGSLLSFPGRVVNEQGWGRSGGGAAAGRPGAGGVARGGGCRGPGHPVRLRGGGRGLPCQPASKSPGYRTFHAQALHRR